MYQTESDIAMHWARVNVAYGKWYRNRLTQEMKKSYSEIHRGKSERIVQKVKMLKQYTRVRGEWILCAVIIIVTRWSKDASWKHQRTACESYLWMSPWKYRGIWRLSSLCQYQTAELVHVSFIHTTGLHFLKLGSGYRSRLRTNVFYPLASS